MSSMNIVKRTGERTEPSKIPLEAEYSGESWSPEEITDLLLLYMLLIPLEAQRALHLGMLQYR